MEEITQLELKTALKELKDKLNNYEQDLQKLVEGKIQKAITYYVNNHLDSVIETLINKKIKEFQGNEVYK